FRSRASPHPHPGRRVVLGDVPPGPAQEAPAVRLDPARQQPRPVPDDVPPGGPPPAAAPRRTGQPDGTQGRRAPPEALAAAARTAPQDVPEPAPGAAPVRQPLQRTRLPGMVTRLSRKEESTMRIHLPDRVATSARRHADAPALTYADTTLTYGRLWREVRRVAAG